VLISESVPTTLAPSTHLTIREHNDGTPTTNTESTYPKEKLLIKWYHRRLKVLARGYAPNNQSDATSKQ
jgi:hypothetical protein